MIVDLNEEDIVLEVRKLIDNIGEAKNEVNIYCDLVKQMFLSNSNRN